MSAPTCVRSCGDGMLQARAGASVQAHGQESTMSHAQHRGGAGPCWARRARSSRAPRAAVVGEGARVDGRGKRVRARHRLRVAPRRAMPVRAPVGSGPRRARARTPRAREPRAVRSRIARERAQAGVRARARSTAARRRTHTWPWRWRWRCRSCRGVPWCAGSYALRAVCTVSPRAPWSFLSLSLSLSLSSARARGARTRVPARAVGSRWPHTQRLRLSQRFPHETAALICQ